jgi:hypothetical protein
MRCWDGSIVRAAIGQFRPVFDIPNPLPLGESTMRVLFYAKVHSYRALSRWER